MIGMEQTGELDEQTFEEMEQPRCGNSDVSGGRERRKRFGKLSTNIELQIFEQQPLV
jgi:hypothetical protein